MRCDDLAAKFTSRPLRNVAEFELLASRAAFESLRDVAADTDRRTFHLVGEGTIPVEFLRFSRPIHTTGEIASCLPNLQIFKPLRTHDTAAALST